MATYNLTVNGKKTTVDVDPDTPLLWVLRDQLNLVGTKYGCGIGQCGACVVHINGQPVASCVLPVSEAAGNEILTIEGLASEDASLHPLQQAWLDAAVPQCGYCQSGQIMQALALLVFLIHAPQFPLWNQGYQKYQHQNILIMIF